MDMQDCWSFTCCLFWTLGSSSKCSQFKSFYRCYICRCSSEQVQLVPLLFFCGRFTRLVILVILHNFSVTTPRCYKDVYVNSFFLHTSRLWHSLRVECFPLTFDLNGCKSRINRHLLAVGSVDFLCFNLFVLLFLVTQCLAVAVQPCMGWISIKNSN